MSKARLRFDAASPPFRVVLVEPEIPPNTGAISRTCAATSSSLHLVGKLGFRIDEHAVRRAGLDYWHLVDLHTHVDVAEFTTAFSPPRMHLFSANATRSYLEADFHPGDALVFGKESAGLSDEILATYPERHWTIPTSAEVRSLNLSNAVAIIVYEALRKTGHLNSPQVVQT